MQITVNEGLWHTTVGEGHAHCPQTRLQRMELGALGVVQVGERHAITGQRLGLISKTREPAVVAGQRQQVAQRRDTLFGALNE
jgi:hypothetical protein